MLRVATGELNPAITVTIESAVSGLASIETTRGATILVPTWEMSGGGLSETVVAVSPQYLNYTLPAS